MTHFKIRESVILLMLHKFFWFYEYELEALTMKLKPTIDHFIKVFMSNNFGSTIYSMSTSRPLWHTLGQKMGWLFCIHASLFPSRSETLIPDMAAIQGGLLKSWELGLTGFTAHGPNKCFCKSGICAFLVWVVFYDFLEIFQLRV